jgi:hypothetical protein
MGFDLLIAGGTDNRIFGEDLLACLVEVRVEQTLDQPTRFAVRFQDDIENGQLKKAGLPELQVGQILTILVDKGEDKYACLCRGPILAHESEMTLGGPGSSLTVLGPDRRDELSRSVREQNWPGRASEVARLLLADTYPLSSVDATEEVYDLIGNTLPQRDNDLEFLTKLGRDHGYHFWISYSGTSETPLGTLTVIETANWKASPPLQEGAPLGLPPILPLSDSSVTLRYNVPKEDCPNLTAFALATDGARPSAVSTATQNLTDGGQDAVEVTDQAAPMGGSGDGLATRAPARQMTPRPQGNAQDSRRRNQAALRDAGFFVSATLSTTRYMLKNLLEPHQVVAVEGVGGANGKTPFRVSSVTHVINGINHFMDAEIETNVQLPSD